MQGIVVEIPDHPKTGHKIKVEITGFDFSWAKETVSVHTQCRYYENAGGSYGDLVSEPAPIVFERSLVANTVRDQFVDARTGQDLVRKYRQVRVETGAMEPIPMEERVEGGPTERLIMEPVPLEEQIDGYLVRPQTKLIDGAEYWVLKSDGVTEVPADYVIRMFTFFEAMVRGVSIVVANLLTSYVQAEVSYGTYYKVGR